MIIANLIILKNKCISKYSAIPVQVKASLWFAICSILQKGLSIITVPMFTRLMTTEQYGYYTTYISWYNLLLVFTSLNLFYGVFNNAMLKYRDNRETFISSMQGLVFAVTALFFIVYLAMKDSMNELLGMNTLLVLMLFLELLVTPCLQFWMASNRYDFKYRAIVIVTLAKTIANPLLGLILVICSEEKDVARIASIVIVETIFCTIIAGVQFYRGKKFFHKEYWIYALWFNIPLIPHYLAGQILSQSDRIMISKLVGNTAVAIYGVAYNIGLLINIFTNAINGSYTPWFYQSLEKNEYKNIRKVTRVIVLFMCAMVVILMFFGPEIISILGTHEYKEGQFCIPPVAASGFFIFLYNIYANVEFRYEKRLYVLFSSLCAAGMNLILNYIFINRYGYIAAAYTTLICYLVYCVLHSLFARLILTRNNIPVSVFDRKTTILASIGVVAIAITMNILYIYTYLRYEIIILLLISFIILRRKLLSLAKMTFYTIKCKD